MSTNDTYLAVFLGSKTSAHRKAWDALPNDARRAKEQEGIAAWGAWAEDLRGWAVPTGHYPAEHRPDLVYAAFWRFFSGEA